MCSSTVNRPDEGSDGSAFDDFGEAAKDDCPATDDGLPRGTSEDTDIPDNLSRVLLRRTDFCWLDSCLSMRRRVQPKRSSPECALPVDDSPVLPVIPVSDFDLPVWKTLDGSFSAVWRRMNA
jgi:hypothetical protein